MLQKADVGDVEKVIDAIEKKVDLNSLETLTRILDQKVDREEYE
jgi:hypothetical protein